MQMPGAACTVVGDQLISPKADVEFLFPALPAIAAERKEAPFIFRDEQEEEQSTPEFEIVLEEENQVPKPSLFVMQAKEDEETDDSTSTEDLVQVEETADQKIPAQTCGSGFYIDGHGRLRRFSHRTSKGRMNIDV